MTKIVNNHKNFQSTNKFAKKALPFKQQTFDLKSYTIQQLYEKAESFYAQQKSKSGNDKWNSFITQKGTKKDKIAFVSAQIIKKPQSSLEYFQLLTKWCFDQNHNFALPACQALTNIYTENIFTEKPSLKIFLDSIQDHIKNNKKSSEVLRGDLIGFYLQHHIKHFYGELIRSINELLTSDVSYIKKTAIKLLASLSKFKQLRRLVLSTLINKFGDSDMQIVNQVSKCLKNQFYEDLQASQTLLQECQVFLFRQNLSQKSQFYVINFLNCVNLKFFSQKSMTKLFELFFHFFTKLMDKQNEQKSISSRLFLNSIKGLNKIFSFMKSNAKSTRQAIQSKIQTVYKMFHKTPNTKAKVQLLLFLFQTCTHLKGQISDRFYRVLYEFLGTNQILHCSLAQMFFDLLLISLKQDNNLNRSLAFIKRILQLCFTAQANFIATCLILIGKVISQKQPLKIMMKQKQNQMVDQENQETKNEDDLPYDMIKREPLYAGAQKTNVWQLTVFKNHYHPTVRKFTQCILNNQQIDYSGSNPLLQLGTASFVQKLCLKKQKKSEGWKIKVKRNLSKIRSSKYESLVDKPLQNFKEDEQFIKKYLQKRETIHKNMKKMQTQDIQQFADNLIQKQMDRLHPQNDDLDLSISQQDLDDQEKFNDEEDFQDDGQDGFEEQVEQGKQNYDEDNQFGSDQDLPEEQFDDFEGDEGQFDDQQLDGQEVSQEKDFQDVFDEINQSQQYPKKGKKIVKHSKYKNFNNKKQKNSKKPQKFNKKRN